MLGYNSDGCTYSTGCQCNDVPVVRAPGRSSNRYPTRCPFDGTQVQQQTDGSQGLGERGQQWERVFLIIVIVGFFILIALLLYLVLKLR